VLLSTFTTLGDLPNDIFSRSIEIILLPFPLPATLPLFASGLGALGLLGWRRKKKATH
jgi:hypothetical protein